jgi:hypothetical protein
MAMNSTGATNLSSKQRTSSSSSSARPAYSLLCDETNTLIISCLRKVDCILKKNERQLDERHRLVEQERHASETLSLNLGERVKRFAANMSLLPQQSSLTMMIESKTILPAHIVEQLNHTKNRLTDLFQVGQRTNHEMKSYNLRILGRPEPIRDEC